MGRKSVENTKTAKNKAKPFDKYFYYRNSVQSPDSDVEFFAKTYKELRKKKPESLCEDFCGTFDICCHWVKENPNFTAIGIDLDEEPISYGKENYLPKLTSDQQHRLKIFNSDVLSAKVPKSDIVTASNFSYYLFKTREDLRNYFKSACRRTADDGLFILDAFGGTQCMEPNEEETEHDGFSYFWDQDHFDPISNHGLFYIHFKIKGEKKREKVFTYDWRMWSIPEIREILVEAGFKNTYVYWEGTDDDGEGDGEFTQTETGEDCEAWVAYIVALK